MSGSGKSEQEHVPHSSIQRKNPGSFWTFHVVFTQNNGKEMYQKCAAVRPIVVFPSSGQGHPTTVFCKISVRRSKFFAKNF